MEYEANDQVIVVLHNGAPLEILDKISEKAGRGNGESGGVQVLMGQPLGILEQFLPKEKKTELKQLLAELTAGGRKKQ